MAAVSGSRLAAVIGLVVYCISMTYGDKEDKAPPDGKPPIILEQADREMWYKPSEKVELKCVASGEPPPLYTWKKNDRPLTINGIGIQLEAGRGTIIINVGEPLINLDGTYQCVASNPFGSALTVKTLLRRAMLEPFPTVLEPRYHRPGVGTPLSFRCNPPSSYPQGAVYWGENRSGPKLKPIETSERIVADYEGGLHFTNVEMYDSRNGIHYVCIVHNAVLRNLVQGDDQVIQPHQITDIPKYEPPAIIWSSPTKDVALRGQTKKMKCIFSGYPTPKVSWTRLDATMPAKNANASFGQELIINDADFTDSGRYQCTASNTRSGTQVAVRDFTLSVESPPYWRNAVQPQNVNADEEDDIAFNCNVNGVPKPTVTWFINGRPQQTAGSSPRRSLAAGGATLRMFNVTKADAMVVQCNATNAHGYLFANAYLSVRAEPPTFVVSPKELVKVSVGQTAILSCRVAGAPRPTLMWQKGSQLIDSHDLHDPRITLLSSGDLQIENAINADEETYQCYTYNKFGSNSAVGKLMITNRTSIVNHVGDHVVTSPEDIVLTCEAMVDTRQSVHYRWTHGVNELTSSSGDVETVTKTPPSRWQLSRDGRQLTVRHATVADSGVYVCRASTDVDHDEVTTKVTVIDRPDRPTDVRLTSCTSGSAEVTWSPGSDNNSPIVAFIVHYNTSHDDPAMTSPPHEGATVNGSARHARIRPLTPWTGYSFYVTAENEVGRSDRSPVGGGSVVCRTPGFRPSRSPRRVCTENRRPGQLAIVWEPMPRIEHSGDRFHYIVYYQHRPISDDDVDDIDHYDDLQDEDSAEQRLERSPRQLQPQVHVEVRDWHTSELVVEGLGTYERYEVAVQAVNAEGLAPNGTVERVIGYTGEDVPLEIPTNFDLDWSTLNYTHAVFSWNGVDESPSRMRGFFRGYQIELWRENETDTMRTVEIIDRIWQPCRRLYDTSGGYDGIDDVGRFADRNKNWTAAVRQGLVTNLWPDSTVVAGVRALNGALMGHLSATLTFRTPEGVPGPVLAIWVSERGSHHLKMSWTAPLETNGQLMGYVISYREATSDGDVREHETMIPDPQQNSKKLRHLKDDTAYVITIWALTSAGSGEAKITTESTRERSVPDRPIIDNIAVGYDFVNVSWQPSSEFTEARPASEYVVEYKVEGADDWDRTTPETEHNWLNVSGLIHGVSYHLRVAAIDRHGDAMKSEVLQFVTGIQPAAVGSRWPLPMPELVGGVCGVVGLLSCCVILVCVISRRRHQGKYPVHEKEKRHGANGGNLYDEAQFGEYVRGTLKKSVRSLDSSCKSDDDITDSLGVYEDVDPIKFTDDGSFADDAGGGYIKIVDRLDPDGTNTSALSSLV